MEKPILAYPKFQEKFYLITDASATGLGFTLSQHINGAERVILYGRLEFSQAEKDTSTMEREALAMVIEYLHGGRFFFFFLFSILLDVPHLTNEHRTQDCIATDESNSAYCQSSGAHIIKHI